MKCLNCNEEVFKSNDNWFHKQSMMYRCDGKGYNQDDFWKGDWVRPTDDVHYIPAPMRPSTKPVPPPRSVSPQRKLLLDAADTVDGERQDQYGNAEDSFAVIAEYWSTLLSAQFDRIVHLQAHIETGNPRDNEDYIKVTAKDVALMMVLFKAAREGNAPKRDNLLDLAGYAALAQRIEESNA